MEDRWSSRWSSSLTLTIASVLAAMLGLTLSVGTAAEAWADHALGFEPQIAWKAQLQKVDDALAQNDLAGAEMLWRIAYAAALKSRHWEGMVAVGDAYRRLGHRAGFRNASDAKAREAYRAALFRARSEGSVDGVLRAAQGFAELDEHAIVAQCIAIARSMAARARDPRAEERVRAFSERWAARAPEVGRLGLP